ncbi:TPA: phage baseplate protein [Pseudomonas aeruginosa]|uniref:phage baseplate protein n=1 Tax=Pseudomonas aeruginosa TaxID=287 RepID=UPI001BCA166B|nr:phage baseplate protein [Pseudomonas aeruginosa]MCO3241381.1 phage baseplate protein [Pseudomonas aeruginosa]HCL3178090.1 phage baseplate protein [Pseudomonas aeruginosa]HCL4147558.1 phage baseplate protein [Pseudomonas aeruginosa]HED8892934.1 phage baseplate protein [Pseudomonas aeruginosa]
MIGIDRDTGATVDDWPQFVQRATRALTTPLGTRQKRPLYGCRLLTRLGRNLGDQLLILAQADAVDAFYNEANGIGDFKPEVVVATREGAGLRLRLAGTWHNRKMTFEVVT